MILPKIKANLDILVICLIALGIGITVSVTGHWYWETNEVVSGSIDSYLRTESRYTWIWASPHVGAELYILPITNRILIIVATVLVIIPIRLYFREKARSAKEWRSARFIVEDANQFSLLRASDKTNQTENLLLKPVPFQIEQEPEMLLRPSGIVDQKV